ncbi:MAG: hypothetical protein ABSB35_11860 [Bryobacteraceae bacterium]
MTRPDYTITPEQLKVYEALERIQMAWIALWAALVLFTVVLAAFLYALFFVDQQDVAKVIMAGIDGTLGWALRTVYAYLFPAKQKRAN